MPPEPVPPCPTCSAHPLLVDNVVAMRQTFDLFVSHAAEEHTAIRETLARQAEQFHKELLDVVRLTAAAPPAEPAGPHPLQRAEDYEQRVILQLSRKDMWRVLGAVAVILVLVLGIAMVAGERGLTLLPKAVVK